MKTYKAYKHEPKTFEGCCYITELRSIFWFKRNRVYHRENGPAIIEDDGTKYWYQNHKPHRLCGAAFEYKADQKIFYIHGKNFSETEFWTHPLVLEHKLNSIISLEEYQ